MAGWTVLGCALAITMSAVPAGAQVSTPDHASANVVTATIEAMDRANREIALKKHDGTHDVFYIPPAIKRFEMLRIGDTVTVRYDGARAIQLAGSPVGDEPLVDADSRQRTFTATVTAIDPDLLAITFIGPHGWIHSGLVADKTVLASMKVGQRVDLTSVEALVLSLEDFASVARSK